MSGISAIMSLLNVKTEALWVCLCTHVAFSPQTEWKHWLCFKLNVCAEYRQVGLSGLSHIHYCIETHFIFIFPSAMKSLFACVCCVSVTCSHPETSALFSLRALPPDRRAFSSKRFAWRKPKCSPAERLDDWHRHWGRFYFIFLVVVKLHYFWEIL